MKEVKVHSLKLIQPLTANREKGWRDGEFLDTVNKNQLDSVEGSMVSIVHEHYYFPAPYPDTPALNGDTIIITLKTEKGTHYAVRFSKYSFRAIFELRNALIKKDLFDRLETVRLRITTQQRQGSKGATFYTPIIEILGGR